MDEEDLQKVEQALISPDWYTSERGAPVAEGSQPAEQFSVQQGSVTISKQLADEWRIPYVSPNEGTDDRLYGEQGAT